jgi:hypothetical protein
MRSLGSSVSIVTRLRAGRQRNYDSISGGLRAFSRLHIQTCSGSTYPNRYRRRFPLGRNYFGLQLTTYLPLLRRLRMGGIVPPLPLIPYSFIACAGTNLLAFILSNHTHMYRGADKSLARPGRKQATTTEDFVVHISYLLS